MELNENKLSKWAKEIYDNATAHGWHDERHSPEHYLGLIMTEVAEAVEADRKGRRVNEDAYLSQFVGHNTWYQNFVKGTVEEEFSDIVIRLLDMAYDLYGADNLFGFGQHSLFRDNKSFIEHAWYFVHDVLNSGMMNVTESVFYVYCWTEHLGINLDQHIEWKMRYNTLRPYKHGGKRY